METGLCDWEKQFELIGKIALEHTELESGHWKTNVSTRLSGIQTNLFHQYSIFKNNTRYKR